MKFSGHHPRVKKEAKFENGSCGVCTVHCAAGDLMSDVLLQGCPTFLTGGPSVQISN